MAIFYSSVKFYVLQLFFINKILEITLNTSYGRYILGYNLYGATSLWKKSHKHHINMDKCKPNSHLSHNSVSCNGDRFTRFLQMGVSRIV